MHISGMAPSLFCVPKVVIPRLLSTVVLSLTQQAMSDSFPKTDFQEGDLSDVLVLCPIRNFVLQRAGHTVSGGKHYNPNFVLAQSSATQRSLSSVNLSHLSPLI